LNDAAKRICKTDYLICFAELEALENEFDAVNDDELTEQGSIAAELDPLVTFQFGRPTAAPKAC